jgi:hypothetical protein
MSEFARGSIFATDLNHAISERRLDGQFDGDQYSGGTRQNVIEQLRAKRKALTVEELAELLCIAVRNSVQGAGRRSRPVLPCTNVDRPVDGGGVPMLAVPTSTSAIGSWIALAPAAGFIAVIERRAWLEDEFLVRNLHGYKKYASLVPSGLPWTTKMRAEMNL